MTRRRRLSESAEDGFALMAVLSAMAVISLFLLATLGYALSNMKPARRDQDAKAALAAAQSGVDEFMARLNANDTYWTNDGNDCSNLALVQAPSAPACTSAKPAAGVAVPGAAASGTTFKYRLLSTTTETASTGFIRMLATGMSRGVKRELTVRMSPVGFLKYIYFTDVEATDPALYRSRAVADARRVSDGQVFQNAVYADPARVDADCIQHYYNDPVTGTSGRANASYRATYSGVLYDIYGYCGEIQFTTGDSILGPLKTNDALQINGSALFARAQPETGWGDGYSPAPAANHRWWGSGTPSGGTTAEPGFTPTFGATLQIPDSNSTLLNAADRANGGPGCLYTGETRITFVNDSTTTKMKVLSPGTTTSSPGCWNAGSPTTEQSFTSVPPVIYVQDATTCGSVRVGYPMTNEATTGVTTDYDCTNGNAYVSGVLNGRVTIGTANDIVITGDITYADQSRGADGNLTGDDVLGLIPQNYAWVYHPVKSDGTNLLSDSSSVHRIDAAILSVKHSFLVQNYNQGAAMSPTDDKKLQVRGAIAQKFRGPVGTSGGSGGSTGYLKAYSYDARLLAAPPPYFLKPVTSPWTVTRVTD